VRATFPAPIKPIFIAPNHGGKFLAVRGDGGVRCLPSQFPRRAKISAECSGIGIEGQYAFLLVGMGSKPCLLFFEAFRIIGPERDGREQEAGAVAIDIASLTSRIKAFASSKRFKAVRKISPLIQGAISLGAKQADSASAATASSNFPSVA
jgi:hypothetical protein